jgi:phosphate transport system substrate-binding protein
MKPLAVLLGLLIATSALASPPPPADASPAEVLRIAGPAELRPLVERWCALFRVAHPAVRVELQLQGSDVAMAALYSRTADLALLGREATPAEVKAFEWIYRYRPTALEIATGSLGVAGRSAALLVLVHRDNPLAAISLQQLDALFSEERLRGGKAPLRTWGDLGLGGDWRDRSVRLYSPDTESGVGRFFRRVVLDDSRLLAWEKLQEFADTPGTPGSHDVGAKIAAALAADPQGLAVAPVAPRSAGVRAIPLIDQAGSPISATPATIASRAYPLTRAVLAYVNRAPNTPLPAKTQAFLALVLSEAGQGAIASEGVCAPLPVQLLHAQRLLTE